MNPQRMSADSVQGCVGCGRKAAHGHVFYIVRIEQAVVDANAARRQAGLEAMVGDPGIAAALGDRDVILHWPYGTGEVHVCSDCFIKVSFVDLMGGMEDE